LNWLGKHTVKGKSQKCETAQIDNFETSKVSTSWKHNSPNRIAASQYAHIPKSYNKQNNT
jgi:hypothetical protein